MDENDFAREIRQAWALINGQLSLGKLLTSNRSLPVDDLFRDVAIDSTSSYEQIYKTGLSRAHYNFLLNDYSYFQFTWDNKSSWRLAYFPNPWISGAPEAADL